MECTDDPVSPYFIQLLLLRLMFGSTKILPYTRPPFDIHTMSTVWKSGIMWSNSKGIDTIVDVVDQSKVLVLMHCRDTLKDKVICLKHRSSLLNCIRSVKQETCPAVETKEFFIEPEYIHHPLKSTYTEVLIFTEDVITTTSPEDHYICSACGHNVDINDVLFFDPYINLCTNLTSALCNPDTSEHAPSSEFLLALSHHFDGHYDLFVQLIKPSPTLLNDISKLQSPTERFVELFKLWLKRTGHTFKSLKELFDDISAFQISSALLPGMYEHACMWSI